MQCLILASGFGTRLYPLTLHKAKALLEYRGMPLINHIVHKVPEHMELFVTTNQKFEQDFITWANGLGREVKLFVEPVYNEEQSHGAIASLYHCIADNKISDDLMVFAADNYFEFSLERFIAAFNGNNALVAIYDMGDKNKCAQFGVVELEGNRIVEFKEKPSIPESSLVATACWILPSRILHGIAEVVNRGITDNMGDFIAYLVATDEVYGYVFEELWIDVGTLDVYHNTR